MRSKVHPKYKTKDRVGNWSAYEQALVQRGDVTLWLSADATDAWRPSPSGRPGAPKQFSDCAIETALTLRRVVRWPLRHAAGCLRSVLSLLGVDLAAPDHTTLSRRSQSLAVACRRIPSRGPIHLIVDSTGLSMVGEGEWAAVKHGGRGHRGWKKLHLAVDRAGVIVAHALTEPTVDDATIGIDLIETVDDEIARVTADAAYDTVAFYEAAGMRDATVVVPPSKTTRVSRRRPRCAPARRARALLRGSKTDPQRPLPTDPLTTDRVRRRPTKLSHLIEDVTCEDGLRLLPRPIARSKALPDDQLVPEEGVLHTGLLMVARVLLPLSPSSLLHLSDRAVARGRSWSPSRHGGCPGRWNDDRRATRTRSLVDATRVVGRVRREAGDVAFDLVDQIEGRRRVVNMPAGQGVSDDHARSVDAQMKLLPAAYTASAMFHGRPFTFTHSREPGTVDDEMYVCARGEAAKCKAEVLTTP